MPSLGSSSSSRPSVLGFFGFFLHLRRCCSCRFLRSCSSLLRRKRDSHSLTFEQRHLLYLRIFFQVVGKTEQQHFTLLFEKDGTSFEEYISLHFITILQEADGMFQLEVIIVLVGLRSETDFFHIDLHLLRLLFLCTLLQLIKELRIIYNSTNWRNSIR